MHYFTKLAWKMLSSSLRTTKFELAALITFWSGLLRATFFSCWCTLAPTTHLSPATLWNSFFIHRHTNFRNRLLNKSVDKWVQTRVEGFQRKLQNSLCQSELDNTINLFQVSECCFNFPLWRIRKRCLTLRQNLVSSNLDKGVQSNEIFHCQEK